MNLFELFVKIGAKDEASGTISKITSGLGKGLATAAKIGTAAVGAAAAGITALTTAAVNNYAEYEQLVGGVDTLFKSSSQKVQEYAANAYKTAGMSANDYMANATAFSASLISSLGGDTEKAAEYANRAMVSMSDNANKMGTSLDSIVQTYQSLSRGNMAMLDNLKLGYGGTKAELERLIKDAASYTDIQKEMGITVDASSMSFDNIVNAIAVVQGKLGIAGATAAEAGTTIEGSVNSMKAAWDNLITGVADKNADLEGLINNLVTSIVGDGTENNLGVIGNVLPAIETALGGIAKLIEGAAPKIIEILPELVERVVPSVISAATGMVNSVIAVLPDLLNTVVEALIQNAPALITAAIGLVQSLIQGIKDNYQILVDGAIQIVTQLATGIIEMLPQIVKLGLDLIVSLHQGIASSIPKLIPTIVNVVLEIVETLTDPKTLDEMFDAALEIIMALAEALLEPDTLNGLLDACILLVENLVQFIIENLDPLIDAAIKIIMTLVNYLLSPEGMSKLMEAAFSIITSIGTALVGAAGQLVWAAGELIENLFIAFRDADWSGIGNGILEGIVTGITSAWDNVKDWFTGIYDKFGEVGGNILEGIKTGIKNAWDNLKDWFSSLFDDLIGIAKKILGIASPSKVFKKIGLQTAQGYEIGFDDEFAKVKDDMENAMNFEDMAVSVGASVKRVGSANGSNAGSVYGTSSGVQNVNVTVTIDENINAMGLARELLPYLKIAAQEAYI